MRARRYQSKDWDMINNWIVARGTSHLSAKKLPKNGFLVDDVACCFLIKTDAKIAVVEYLVTNPAIAEEIIMQALDLIWAEIEKEAHKLKCSYLYAYTDIVKVMAVAMRMGMVSDGKPYYFFKKALQPLEMEKENGRRNESSERGSEFNSGDFGEAETA